MRNAYVIGGHVGLRSCEEVSLRRCFFPFIGEVHRLYFCVIEGSRSVNYVRVELDQLVLILPEWIDACHDILYVSLLIQVNEVLPVTNNKPPVLSSGNIQFYLKLIELVFTLAKHIQDGSIRSSE